MAPSTSAARPLRPLILAAVFIGLGGAALAAEVGELVSITAPVAEDVYAGGRAIKVAAAIQGDLTAAGQSIHVAGPIAGDVLAMGETLDLSGPFADDLRVAGRTVTIRGPVGDHVIAAGETVTVAKDARIAGFAWLGGRQVDVDGEIDGDVSIGAGAATISGVIKGDLRLDVGEAVIGSGARIGGDLTWREGHAPTIQEGAVISGERHELPGGEHEEEGPTSTLGSILFNAITLMVLTATTGALMTPTIEGATAVIRRRPWASLGIGLLALIGAPIAAVVAMVTMIGAPLGIAALLGLGILLILSAPVALSAILAVIEARRGGAAATTGRRLAAIAVGSLVFALIAAIPVLGGLATFLAVLVGLGALVLRLLRGERALG
ncbi:MAG: hypothetical protein H6710_10920 [Myxococcales bacterium]|nr:hypothetical protein [Myxococcales bacterium]